jgi:2-keto-4-pentenoate hydratase
MKTFRPPSLIFISLVLGLAGRLDAITAEEWAEQIFTAQARSQPMPALGAQERDATEYMAYSVQKVLNEKKIASGDKMIGHKAGLTSMAAQNKFGMIEPVSGALFESQKKNTATFVSLRQFKGMVVEMEIGFELKLSIRQAPETIEELKTFVRQVVPVVELPNIYYTPRARLTGADLIATNVAASTVVVGRGKPVEGLDLNAIKTELKRDDTVVSEGEGKDAMGDQWEALMWLVRQRLQQGFEVKRNDLLITGAIGKVVEAERGRYVADFGQLGRVTFSMR